LSNHVQRREFFKQGAAGIAAAAVVGAASSGPSAEKESVKPVRQAPTPPVLVVRPDNERRHAFAGEMLRSEGIYFFEEVSAQAPDLERWRGASLLVLLSGSYDTSLGEWLVDYGRQGGSLLMFRPDALLAGAFGLSTGPAMPNTRVRIREGKGLPASPEDLLCPGHTSNALSGRGDSLAELLSTTYRKPIGEAVVAQKIGKGRAISLAYDPVETCIRPRHGWTDYDMPPGGAYAGPRSIWAFKGLESLYTKRVPIGDVHADVLRILVFDLLSHLGVLPRLWHLPDAAKSLFFLKGDGCGEQGADVEIALAEKHGAKLTFYAPRRSRYQKLLRQWAERGHAIAPEFNVAPVTGPVTMATVTTDVIGRIRAIVEDHAQSLKTECGVDFQTVCFHGCQWVGLPQVRMVEENDWWMITSFISFYPGMQKKGYGIYAIPSFMPTRYYDDEAGLCQMIYAPAAWDESQSIGRPTIGRQQAGLSAEEYVAEFERVMSESVERYHLAHVANFHPCYIIRDASDPRYSGAAAEGFLSTCQRLHVPCPSLEDWCKFIRDRWSVRLDIVTVSPRRTSAELTSSRGVHGLTVFLPGASDATRAALDGRPLDVRSDTFEGCKQRYVVFDLTPQATAELVVMS
jgi:hypothetical protein